MNISPQAWRKISELLDTAMEMNSADREIWLTKLESTLAPDQLDVVEPLRKMLAQEARLETNDILHASPNLAGALLAESKAASEPGELRAGVEVGAYRLIRELGRGGMASVWYAERIDGKLKRNVAIKFPYTGPTQRQLAKRLLQERDILANLEHPNIARLYDADATNADRPFLVLEYVDGKPIDEFCGSGKIPLNERLALFRQVFNAVQYAHTRLVIHRDLKPSNMLVTADGVVRLLDFGIAKVLADDGNVQLTELGSRVLTPSFASPEQISGTELTTASDVYALGVVLYQLLTGARPYRLKHEGRAALEDAIAAADIATPSDAALAGHGDLDAERTARALRGDLDTILLKALKKDPAERYSTVAAFADDVDRFLRGEPVVAQRDSPWYRARKFAGRNRLAVAATIAVVASLGIGLSFSLWQLHAARVAQKRAEDVKEFIASIFRSADPFFTGNKSMSATDLLTLATQRIDRELQNQPANAMELLNIVGESQVNLEDYAAAQATLQKVVSLGGEARNGDALQVAQAQARIAHMLAENGDFAGAKLLLAQSIPVLRKAGAKGARVLSDALQFQAMIDADSGSEDLAIAESREAYQTVLAALGPKDSETILSKRHWAQQLTTVGRYEEALPLAKQAFEESQTAFAPGERNALLPETEGLYGRVLVELDRLEPGIEHLNKTLEMSTQIYGPKSMQRIAMLSYLMRAQLRLGDLDAMIDSASKAVDAVTDERAGARPLMTLGDAYSRARKFSQAEPILRKAVAAEKTFDTEKGSWLPAAQAYYAIALLQLGRATEAESLLKQNADLVGESKSAVTTPHWNAVGIEKGMAGKWIESEEAFRQLLARTTDSAASARWRTEAWNGIGLAQLELGRIEEAERSLREADKAVRIAYLKTTPPRADVWVSLAKVLVRQNRAAEALPLIDEADRYWREVDPNCRWAGEAAYWRGKVLLATGKNAEARDAFARAAAILKKSPVAGDAKLAEAASAASRT